MFQKNRDAIRFTSQIPRVKTLVLFLFLVLGISLLAQNKKLASLWGKKVVLDAVFVSTVWVTKATPVPFSNFTKEELALWNLDQDIPIELNFLPSVVTTSNSGGRIGYTSIRVRGTDATCANITINGIPYNAVESHGTFWVNIPHIASSTESIQLQRGVVTSTNGASVFSASLNIFTDAVS